MVDVDVTISTSLVDDGQVCLREEHGEALVVLLVGGGHVQDGPTAVADNVEVIARPITGVRTPLFDVPRRTASATSAAICCVRAFFLRVQSLPLWRP